MLDFENTAGLLFTAAVLAVSAAPTEQSGAQEAVYCRETPISVSCTAAPDDTTHSVDALRQFIEKMEKTS